MRTESLDVETKVEANFLAQLDYELALGSVVEMEWACVSTEHGDHQEDVGPIQCRLLPSKSLSHYIDEYLDPYWEIEIVDEKTKAYMDAKGLGAPWTIGPPYRVLELMRKRT